MVAEGITSNPDELDSTVHALQRLHKLSSRPVRHESDVDDLSGSSSGLDATNAANFPDDADSAVNPDDNGDDDRYSDFGTNEHAMHLEMMHWAYGGAVDTSTLKSDPFMQDPCICGQCSTKKCEATLNFVQWIARRLLDTQARQELRMLYSLGSQTHQTESCIMGDEEHRGLEYLESVLPFSKSLAGKHEMCQSCKGIGSSICGSTKPSPRAKLEVPLYRIKGAANNCSFCRFLIKAIQDLLKPHPVYCFRCSRYNANPETVICILEVDNAERWNPFNRKLDGEKFVSLKFHPPPLSMVQHNEELLVLHSIALSPTGESFTSGRKVEESHVSQPVLRAWVSDCVAQHGDVCNGSHLPNADGKLRYLRLVDVQDHCIVRQDPSMKYIALSYVWGQATSLQLTRDNEVELCKPGSLHAHTSKIPQTFLDAFEVVRCVGERYIWIDALCITQDAEDKEAHMQDMHLVYGAAIFTIVAGGDDANAGLPGIRPFVRNRNQIWEELCPGIGVAVSLPPPTNLRQSRWSLRAWTYQEQLLSKRFLIFFDDQVTWQCPTLVNCEDTLADNKTQDVERLKHFSSSTWYEDKQIDKEIRSGFRRPLAFQRYGDIVHGYTGRELSFPEDILYAFSGVGKVLMLDLNTEMVEGLPLAFLDAALLWQPCHQLSRRKGNETFASWSWAGWEGKVAYEDTTTRDEIEGLLPIIKWSVHRSELPNRFGIGTKAYLLKPGIESKTWKPPFEPDRTSSNTLTNVNAQLKFWTSCSFFRELREIQSLTDLPTKDESKPDDPRQLSPQRLGIVDAHGRSIGIVTVTGARLRDYDPSRHEYIVLSEAQFAGIDLVTQRMIFSAEPSMCRAYNIMLVEWNKDKTCAYRVGLGRIMKYAWAQSKPRNKFVTLG